MPKFLYYPVAPYQINQLFGVNPATYAQFGLKAHNGLDLRAYHGQPIYAAHDGVAYFETDSNQGEGVVLISNEEWHYNEKTYQFSTDTSLQKVRAKTIYWHMCDEIKDPKYVSPVLIYQRAFKTGMPVKAGDVLGYADSTGYSTGDHLHFGLKPIKQGSPNPQDATDDTPGNWVNVSPNNGYLGSIDPIPYFNQFSAAQAQYVLIKYSAVVEALQKIKKIWELIRFKK